MGEHTVLVHRTANKVIGVKPYGAVALIKVCAVGLFVNVGQFFK
jgi:hypothetical protein